MIDKLDVRIPEFSLPGPVLAEPMERLRRAPHPLFRRTQYYQYVCNLRDPFGVDAMVHLSYRYGRKNHKVEILDAGEKTLDEMAGIIRQVFDVDPWSLEVMRTDLTADIEGVPVPWFKDFAYINRKQYSSRIEKSFESELQFVYMGSAVAQTIYAGKRPNHFRIYDKLAEWRIHYRKIVQDYSRFNRLLDQFGLDDEQRYYAERCPPTFQEYCKRNGYSFQPGNMLTRVERQIGGKVPKEFATVADLRNAHNVDPFTALQIVPSARGQFTDAVGDVGPVTSHVSASRRLQRNLPTWFATW